MKKLLLAVALVWAAMTVFPGLRERAEPRMASARDWSWDIMEGPLSPITNRYRRIRAESEMADMNRILVFQRNQGDMAPTQDEFARFLTRHDIAAGGLDPWGTPYQVAQEGDSLVIRSAGPDLRHQSGDDLVVKIRYPDRQRARGTRR